VRSGGRSRGRRANATAGAGDQQYWLIGHRD
jgi:hypothetical protein